MSDRRTHSIRWRLLLRNRRGFIHGNGSPGWFGFRPVLRLPVDGGPHFQLSKPCFTETDGSPAREYIENDAEGDAERYGADRPGQDDRFPQMGDPFDKSGKAVGKKAFFRDFAQP